MTKITTKITFIGLLMGAAILYVIATTLMINSENRQDATVINIAGKQRMLTQKITRHVYGVHLGEQSALEELSLAVKEFEEGLEKLALGNPHEGIYPPPTSKISSQLEKIKEQWKLFAEAIDRFRAHKEKLAEADRFFGEHNNALLTLSDEVVKAMVNTHQSPEWIDKAGAQRMLSQRMASHLLLHTTRGERQYLEEFQEAFRMYDQTLQLLQNGDLWARHANLGDAIKANGVLWERYKKSVQTMLEHLEEASDAHRYIREYSTPLLQEVDMAVTLYNLYSEERRGLLQNFQYASGIVMLFLIVYAMMITQGIKEHMEEFLEKSRMLANLKIDLGAEPHSFKHLEVSVQGEAELQEASGHINAFIRKIGECAKKSGEAQVLAERIAEELASIAGELSEELEGMQIDPEEKKRIAKEISKSEDMAIQSSEEIISAAKLLKHLQKQLSSLKEAKI